MTANSGVTGVPAGESRGAQVGPRYKWIALSNTTLGVLMATINHRGGYYQVITAAGDREPDRTACRSPR
jgi:hypothetical protein